jgi:putative membrane protein
MRLIPIAMLAACAVPLPAFAQATTGADFVKMAGASDLYEMQSSKLELTSKDPKIKQYAQQMITDHTKSTQQVKAAAAKDGVKAGPPMLMPEQKTQIAQLRAAKGSARDQMYIEQQKQSHQMALQLHQGYSQSGDKENLKATATAIAPVVQGHIDMLNGMGSGGMSGAM